MECVNDIAEGAGSRSWIAKMKVTRVVRSSKALELVLSRTVQEGYSVRPVYGVIQDDRHQCARIERSFELINICIRNKVGIADITRPGFWF